MTLIHDCLTATREVRVNLLQFISTLTLLSSELRLLSQIAILRRALKHEYDQIIHQ